MVDMHMHTIYSDGEKTVAEVLKMCEERKLEYISITDHDTCKQYDDEALKNNTIFSGKIIKGTELHAVFQQKNIEILAYEVDPDVINQWCEKYYSDESLRKQQIICRQRMFDICDKHGLIYDKDNIPEPKTVHEYVEHPIYDELMRHEENRKILGEEYTETNFGLFFRKEITNPESSYFMNHVEFRPPYKEVIGIIHEAGGKAFFAHPFEYQFQDTMKYISDLRKEAELDGIECFHPSSMDDDKKDILYAYARENHLYVSGGSDYHGKPKPDIQIGIGRGNLNLNKEIVEEWIKK